MTGFRTLPSLLLSAGIAAGSALAFAIPAAAQLQGSLPEDKMKQLEERLETLEKNVGKVKIKDNGLRIDSLDKMFQFRAGGRIMYDITAYDDDVTALTGFGHEMRRARFFLRGKLYKDWEYKFQVDVADNGLDIKDMYIKYKGFSPVNVTVGQFKVPFSFEELTSSKYDTFIEQSAVTETLGLGRQRGAMLNGGSGMFGAAFGVFLGDDTADTDGSDATADDDIIVAGRLFAAPVNEKARTIHIGGGFIYQNLNSERGNRFRARPARSHLTSTRLIDTGTISAIDDITRFGAEFAGVYDQVWIQAEYQRADVSRIAGNEPDFDGAYINLGAFLFGEGDLFKPYDDGEFGRPKVFNAVEVAFSYDTLDLTDSGVDGGEQDSYTFGLNYYFNPYVVAKLNYSQSDIEVPGSPDEDVGAFMARIQLDF